MQNQAKTPDANKQKSDTTQRNPQSQPQQGQKDFSASNQNAGQKNPANSWKDESATSGRVGNNIEKDEPLASRNEKGGMKNEGHLQSGQQNRPKSA